MAVGPREAIIFRRLPKRTKQLEEYIDRHLRRYYNGEVWIEIPVVELNSDMLKQLIEDYKFVGWKKVEFLAGRDRKPFLRLSK